MGKPKKGKKGQDQDDLSDEEFSSSTGAGTKMGDDESDLTNQAATKKMKKGKKSRKDDDLEDIEAEIAAMSLEMNKDSKQALEEEEVHVVSKKKKKEKKRVEEDANEMESPAVARFQLLGLMDDGNEDEVVDNDDGKESEDEKAKGGEVVLESVGNTDASHGKKEKKKKKGKEKTKTAEEEDVDAILAELNEPSEKKKGKKGKQRDTKEGEQETPQDEPQTVAIEVKKLDPKVVTIDDCESDEDSKKKKKKTGKKEVKEDETGALEGDEEEDEDGGTVKTAAQKKKEKKERERLKKLQQKQKQQKKDAVTADDKAKSSKQEGTTTVDTEQNEGDKAMAEVDSEEEGEKEGKKKKKKKGEKDEKPKTNKRVAAIKEHLAKVKEEEERKRREEEEAERLEQERIQKLEEQKRLEEERRLKKKLKKKEREERAKKEGRFLTEKQKQDRMRLNQMLEIMKEQGVGIPTKEEVAKKKPLYTKKKKETQPKDDAAKPLSPSEEKTLEISSPVSEESKLDKLEEPVVTEVKHDQEENEAIEVKDAWDEESQEEDSSEEEEEETGEKPEDAVVSEAVDARQSTAPPEENNEESDGAEDESEEESETEEESSETESDDDRTPAERGKEKVRKRHEAAEKKRTTEVLRAPVVCVLGHVDTGKTKILDKLRRTNVQEGEAGGITQQIGATNVPKDAILEKTKMCKEFMKQDLKLPGLLIIDTPGHESFSNLRSRGSSLCDIAVLVIDIMHGLEPQTIESINLLKQRKTPFVVALNKIDRLYQWKSNPQADVYNTIKRQTPHTKSEFDERARSVITQLAQEGLNAALFYENKNVKEYVSLVPTSAHSGDGMGNLVALICELTQSLLAKRLAYSEEMQATVMEVKALPGLGTTIDVVLVNGRLCEGATMILAGTEGPIVTPIRGLLMPQPMKELRVKNQYEHHKEVLAAQGVKIIAKDLEKALAGLPLYISHDQDEIEYYKQEVEKALEDALKSIRLSDRGVFVQASTLGSLEALLEFLRTSKVKYAGINIGPVHKKDIMKASIMLEHDPQYAVILAFDVRVEREAQELADHLGVKIFTADIIYHLFDKFTAYREELIKKRQEEFRHIAVFPCKLRILPQFIFNSRDPIVIGVQVEAGFLKEGTPLCVPSKEFVEIGRVASIEFNHKPVEIGRQGQEVCIKIVPVPGEAPKMYGRHFEETDLLISKISRESIDAVKEHFRKEMSKTDWMLVMELKKLFQIL